MPEIFDALPGIEVPVGSIATGSPPMWEDAASDAASRPPRSEDATATQVNLVLHLGFNTDAEDAVRQFETAVEFSRCYPSRVVVLCPIARRFNAAQRSGRRSTANALLANPGTTRAAANS